jgi:hypothetical protein
METWAEEGYVGRDGEETLMQTATAIGGMRVLVQLIEQLTPISTEVEGI